MQSPVVQSIASLMRSLGNDLFLVPIKSSVLIYFAELLQQQLLTYFLAKNANIFASSTFENLISCCLIMFSFEELGPDHTAY